jgi:hypothetical protein
MARNSRLQYQPGFAKRDASGSPSSYKEGIPPFTAGRMSRERFEAVELRVQLPSSLPARRGGVEQRSDEASLYGERRRRLDLGALRRLRQPVPRHHRVEDPVALLVPRDPVLVFTTNVALVACRHGPDPLDRVLLGALSPRRSANDTGVDQ